MSSALAVLAPVAVAIALLHRHWARAGRASERVLLCATVILVALALASVAATLRSLRGDAPTAGALEAVALVVASLGTAIGLARAKRAPALSNAATGAPRSVWIAFGVAGAVVTWATVERSARLPDGAWDSIAIWSYRARMLLFARADPDAVFRDASPDSHPDYPLMVPGILAWGWAHAGETPWVGIAIGVAFLALVVTAVTSVVARLRTATAGALAGLAVLALPHLVRVASSRMADLPLAAALALAVAWLAIARDAGDPPRARRALVLCGLCAGVAAWTKNEGLVHLAVLGLVATAAPPLGLSRVRSATSFLAGALPMLVLIAFHRIALAPPNDLVAAQGDATLARLADPSRWAAVAAGISGELARFSRWAFVLPAALLALALPRRARASDGSRSASAVVLLVLLAYALVYLVTPYVLARQLQTSFDRVVFQIAPAAILAAFLRWSNPASSRRCDDAPTPAC